MKTLQTSKIAAGRALLLTLIFCAVDASADSYRGLAKGFSRAAAAAGVLRVAVLPLSPVDGSENFEGRLPAERLTTQLARVGKVKVIERSLLQSLMSEQFLGQTGALDVKTIARIGRLAQAQAVLTGTFATVGGTLEINVRLIDVETGVLISADQATLKREFSKAAAIFPEPAFLGAEQAVADVAAFQSGEEQPAWAEARDTVEPGYRDSLNDLDCRHAAARVEALQQSILTLKARYWAGRAREAGFSAASMSRQPGSVIADPELRRKFFGLLRQYAAKPPAPLTASEVQRFVAADGRAFLLHQTCSL